MTIMVLVVVLIALLGWMYAHASRCSIEGCQRKILRPRGLEQCSLQTRELVEQYLDTLEDGPPLCFNHWLASDQRALRRAIGEVKSERRETLDLRRSKAERNARKAERRLQQRRG